MTKRVRAFLALFALGFIGIPSVLPEIASMAADYGVSPMLLIISELISLSLLLGITVAIGMYAAPRVGFRSLVYEAIIDGTPVLSQLKSGARLAVPVGIGVGVVLIILEAVMTDSVAASVADPTPLEVLATAPFRFLYGGVTEELMLRWGVMSLLAFGLWWVGLKIGMGREDQPGPKVVWGAIVLAAGLFAIGHLPMAQTMFGTLTGRLLAYILLGNAIGGIVFGWFFWRYNLETAMITHACAHIPIVVIGMLLAL